MLKRKTSAYISLIICIASAAVLVIWLFTFPRFFNWLYVAYHSFDPALPQIQKAVKTVTVSFYCCAPFAATALCLLIMLLKNIIKEKVFILNNVYFIRYVSWCCYGVFTVTFIGGFFYAPVFIIAFCAAVVGTLLRVVKNIMQSAVELREENDLTI